MEKKLKWANNSQKGKSYKTELLTFRLIKKIIYYYNLII